ncbi:MAG: GNAT family N-acetyltransferase [Negativicutes bacterium]|nr:GNAT family N-acetyltransferase [Negativicutes bacterium]
MVIEKATVLDAQRILGLQKLAYISEAEIYNDFTIPPLFQTLAEIEDEFTTHVFLKAALDGTLVGSVRAYEKNKTCHIGKLMVHPEFRKQGLGARLVTEMEACFATSDRYELFTGHKSEKNISLYKKLGYTIFKTEAASSLLCFIYLEKVKG